MRFQSKIHYIFFFTFWTYYSFYFFSTSIIFSMNDRHMFYSQSIMLLLLILCRFFFWKSILLNVIQNIISESMSTCLRLVGLYTVEGINKREYLNYGFAKAYWHVEWCRKIFIFLQKLDKKSVCVLTKI